MGIECYLCEASFEDQNKLDFHFKKVHLKMLTCLECPNFSALFKPQWRRHRQTVHGEAPTSAQVKPAAKKFEGSKPLAPPSQDIKEPNAASLTITPVPNSAQQQSPTNQMFQTVFDFDYNFEDDDDTDRLECDMCWFHTTVASDLEQHLEAQHQLPKQDISLEVSQQQSELAEKKKTKAKVDRNIHIGITDGVDTFPSNSCSVICGICNFQTNDPSAMENHLGKGYHFYPGSKVVCQVCKNSPNFNDIKEVAQHGRAHSTNFSLYRMNCLRCSVVTTDARQMQNHVKVIHSEDANNIVDLTV